MKQLAILLIIFLFFTSCENKNEIVNEKGLSLIPMPESLKTKAGNFLLNDQTLIYTENEFKTASDFLMEYISNGSIINLKYTTKDKASILFLRDSETPSEGYTLDVSENRITITSGDGSGAFWAIQTLRQLLPVELESQKKYPKNEIAIPNIVIEDAPAFKYRGMHLDVGRHFFPKEFIKKYIARLAMLKMNYFHWHLTEDQGWRIEIKKYPRLTTHGAYREETLTGHYNDTPHQFDGIRYGGFYTQDDIREIVDFATKHKVTIIPEIEMPGHSQAAISAYPELGCTGEEIPVATKWGVFEEIYCPNEFTFGFLKDVLTEVMDLFPGKYIHIGGDEAPKKRWKDCDHCQKLIQDLNLKDEHGLQSYFIEEIEKFVNAHEKRIIGWDEILEGGLAPNATVMSWRGIQGAIDAAKQDHNVILTPTSHCYFDYYQANFSDEPLAIGGYLPLKKVYGFDPIPEELNKEESQYVLGAQGNVWTEYIKTEEQVEYMVFPRILAMSEVVWSGASQDIKTEYPEFLIRVESYMDRMDLMNINYANHLYEIEGVVSKVNDRVYYQLTTPSSKADIHYSINQSEFLPYSKPILIEKNSHIEAKAYTRGNPVGHEFNKTILFHNALTADISMNSEPHPSYSEGGKKALINGIKGSDNRYGDKEWLGFWGDDLEITLDLKEEIEIKSVSSRLFNAPGQWIHAPKEVTLILEDTQGDPVSFPISLTQNRDRLLIPFKIDLSSSGTNKTKQVKLIIPNYGVIPEGNQGAGNNAWTFIDEIIIE